MTEVAVRGSNLAIASEQQDFTEAQIEALRNMNGWDQIPDAELSIFFHQAKRTGLDPFAKQIYLIGRYSKKKGRADYTIQTSIDGMRLVADRTGRYAGSDRPVFGEDGKDRYAEVSVHKLVGASEARATFTGVAYWSEFHDERSPMWKKMPRAMLAKCAEAQALRKAFPADLSGLYSTDEMNQSNAPDELGVGSGEEDVPDRASTEEARSEASPESASPERHLVLLAKIEELLPWVPDAQRPDNEKVLAYARQKLGNAEQALARVQSLIGMESVEEEEVEEAEIVEEPEGDGAGVPPAKLKILKALADDIYRDKAEHLEGHQWLQREMGKPLEDWPPAHVDRWIEKLQERWDEQRAEPDIGGNVEEVAE